MYIMCDTSNALVRLLVIHSIMPPDRGDSHAPLPRLVPIYRPRKDERLS